MISFQEYKAKRDREHKQRMLSTTERDLALSKHPYGDYIPHTMTSWSMRQDVDQYELNS